MSCKASLVDLLANARDMVLSLDWEDPLEKEMATQSSILAWRTPWTEEPGGLQSMESKNVRHNLATEQQQSLHDSCLCIPFTS